MTPQEVLEQHRAAIVEVGEAVSIRRFTGGSGSTRTYSDTATTARVISLGASANAEGTAVQYRYKIIALVDTLAAVLPVTTADRIILDDGKELAILDAGDRKRRIAGVLIALEMECEG
jgi:hypothetical protein